MLGKSNEKANRRLQDLEIVVPDDTQALEHLISSAKVCLSSVVYAVDGDAIIRACIEQRTDYVDWFALSLFVSHWTASS